MTRFEEWLAKGIAEQVQNPRAREEKSLPKQIGIEVRNARSREAVVLFLVIVGALAFLFYSFSR